MYLSLAKALTPAHPFTSCLTIIFLKLLFEVGLLFYLYCFLSDFDVHFIYVNINVFDFRNTINISNWY